MDLGVHQTIYEEDEEIDENSSSASLSPQSGVPWSWRHPDVVIHVQGSLFRLNKDALTARSAHLKRHLAELPEITLSPPLHITPQTFSLVTDFCYGAHVAVTPFNVAALRTAAHLLGMTEVSGPGDQNLLQITEAYFRRVVVVDRDCASIVLRSCFPLLPEAETAASLVSRCVETLAEADGDYGYLDEMKSVGIEVLKVILESLNQRLTDRHDVLYKIIDIFLKENNGKVSETEKIKMCNYIDCSMLSPRVLMHAVQNPRMPLRFVVQAMFLQQLNTRHSILSATDRRPKQDDSATTLGAILQRDAALREVSHLKSIMTNTHSRIQTLEKELSGMRKVLSESESIKNRTTDSARSVSFRFSSETNKIERGQTGSVSSLTYRDVARPSSSEGSPHDDMNFGRRLIKGLRNAFRLPKKKGSIKNNEIFKENLVIIKKDQAFDREP